MAYDTYSLPRLDSYKEALSWYERTTPIRGTTTRPLGKRRYHMCASIEKHDECIVLVYERRQCVTWRPDDTFTVRAPQYYNAFQPDKMVRMLPRGCGFEWNSGRLYVFTDGGSRGYPLPKNGTLEFVRRDDGGYMCVTSNEPVEYKMRRGAQNRLVAKHFTPFLSWAQVVCNQDTLFVYQQYNETRDAFLEDLGYPELQRDAYARSVVDLPPDDQRRLDALQFLQRLNHVPFTMSGDRWFSRPACELMFQRLSGDDATHWPAMLQIVAHCAGTFTYVRNSFTGGYLLSHDDIVRYLKELVGFLFADQVFEIERLQPGQVPSARNARFGNELVHPF